MAVVLAAGALVSGSVAGAAPACSSWSLVPDPSHGKSLNGLAAVGAADIWGLGNAYGSHSGGTLAEHWDGAAWTVVPSQDPSPHAVFNGVAAVSTDDVWGVGYSQPKAAYRTLAERWDGTSWKVVATPNPGSGSDSLTAITVAGANDAWAVGYDKSGGSRVPIIEHWDGSTWSAVAGPSVGSTSSALLGVAAAAADDVWAVGYRSTAGGYRTLVEHWDGAAWQVVPSADPGTVEDVLTSVAAGAGGAVWAAGYQSDGSSDVGLTERWRRSSWSAVPPAQTGGGDDAFRTVAVAGSDDVWAAGTAFDSAKNGYVSLLEHWNGSAWSVVQGAVPDGKQLQILAFATVPGSAQLWAAGRAQGAFVETCGPAGSGAPRRTRTASRSSLAGRPAAPLLAPRPPPAGSGSPAAIVVRDRAAAAGIAETTVTRGAVVLDYNRDGLPDIFLGRHQNPARLYRNNGDGTFTEVQVGAFPHHDRHRCATADVNRDGLPDLFCAIGADQGTEVKHDELWIEQPDHTFKDEAGLFGVADPFGRGRRPLFVDVNGDGYPDLVVGNESDRADGLPSPNRLYLNEGGTRFVDVPTYGLDQEIDALCLRAGDYNGDGRPDVVDCTHGRLRLFRNDGGSGFTDVTSAVKLQTSALDADFVDLNGDGRLDLAVVTSSALQVWLWSGSTFHLSATVPITSPTAVTATDLNGDGSPDLYVVTGRAPACHDPSTGGDNCPDEAFLNSGDGTFTPLDVSGVQTSVGQGEAAVPIAYPGPGDAALIVLNGGDDSAGPVQLLTFSPAESASRGRW